jgi:hypothetical protein
MKRKAFWVLVTILSQGVIFPCLGFDSSPAATINKITTQIGKLNTRIILETDTALSVARTYFATKAIVLELDHINLSTHPPIEASRESIWKRREQSRPGFRFRFKSRFRTQ